MLGFIIRRVLAIIPVLFIVALITFFMMQQTKGGPFDSDKPLNASTLASLNAKFGLDKPVWINTGAVGDAWNEGEKNPLKLVRAFANSQFGNYVINAVQGDLGPTYDSRGTENVQDVIKRRFPVSLRLGAVSVVFALLLGLPLGILGALRQNTIFDYLSLVIATIGISVPSFVVGVLVIIFLSSALNIKPIRPPDAWEGFSSAYIVPGMVLGLGTMAFITRLTRSSMLEVKQQDYIRTARAKGLAGTVVIIRHMLRNALIPVVTILGPAIAGLITGSFIIESIFRVPGVGSEFVSAITHRDYSMIMGATLFFALLVALANLSVDITYGFLDPRIRSKR